jgi:hypothetical protein
MGLEALERHIRRLARRGAIEPLQNGPAQHS